jgi:hypothetical protein
VLSIVALKGGLQISGFVTNTGRALNDRTENTMKCQKCGAALVAKPVPGAKQFPRRLECPEHGWQQEQPRAIRMRFHKDRPNW